MITPVSLDKGDTIGIVSPSGAVAPQTRHHFYKGIKCLKSLGFKVKVGKNALKVYDYSAGTPEERAKDINSMFADKRIDAILCSQGGATANSVLPFLDWPRIRNNPKVFIGMSDASILLNTIYFKTDLITFHGPDLMWGFGAKPTKYETKEFLDRVVHGKIGRIHNPFNSRCIRSGIARGKLLGGNLGSLLNLAGTRFFPDLKDSIMFVEGYGPTPQQCDYMLHQLEQMGVFDRVKGMIVGHIHSLQSAKKKLTQMEDILMRVSNDYDFPILKVNNFGHECQNTVIPVGVRARLEAGRRKIEILQTCVRDENQ